ncbi:MAG TPA: hypothetical protein PKK26_18475, partial [Candidatus Wallbacteria bacterium]|nr:hypothetical protein [Candidatus Wallbacteria bacterium]
VYSNSVRKHEKQQLLGLFTSSGRAMGRSVDEAVGTLYNDYNRNDYALFNERRKNADDEEKWTSASAGYDFVEISGGNEEPRVDIYNPTKYAMMVKLTSKTGAVRTMNVQPRAGSDMAVPAGTYNCYMFTVDDPMVNSSNKTVVFRTGRNYKLTILKDRCDGADRIHHNEVALNY